MFMRYKSVKRNAVKRFSPELPHGIDLENGKGRGGEKLYSGLNVYRDKGRLATRPAVVWRPDSVIQFEAYEATEKGMTLTENTACFGGIVYRIAYMVTGDYTSYQDVRVFLFGCAGDITPIGTIRFNRVDATTFYTPAALNFFQGKAQSGCGIYALFCCRDTYGRPDIYSAYELDKTLENWNDVNSFYEPTVYINGRGGRFGEAQEMGFVCDAKPEAPEALNMLNGRFRAFYTTDGLSSSFKLPVSRLNDTYVRCKMYVSPEDYVEWIISGGTNSATAEYGTSKIKMTCDRAHGILYFFCDEQRFSLPFVEDFGINNLEITAEKYGGSQISRVFNCKKSTVCGSRVMMYSNPDAPAEICMARLENPLYFPEAACVRVGDISEDVTAVKKRGGDIAVFKGGSIYEMTVKDGGYYRADIPLGESNNDMDGLFAPDTVSCGAVCLDVGCDRPSTIGMISGTLFWQTGAGSVYALEKGKNVPVKISDCIKTALTDSIGRNTAPPIGAAHRGIYYLFFKDGDVFVFDTNGGIQKGAWYIWKIPDEVVISAVYTDADRMILCCSDKIQKAQYIADFGTGNDRYLKFEAGALTEKVASVATSFSFACYPEVCPESLKSIGEILVTFETDGELSFSCEGAGRFDTKLVSDGTLKTARIVPKMRGLEGLDITFSANCPFSVSGIAVLYRDFPRIRWAAT